MASWRGERSIAELCREHDISESLLRRWRDQALEAGMERALGRKTYELEIAGKLLRDWE